MRSEQGSELLAITLGHPLLDDYLAFAIHQLLNSITRSLGKPRRYGRWWLAVLAIALAVVALSWIRPYIPTRSGVAGLADTTAAVWQPADGWLMTGHWEVVNPTTCGIRTLPGPIPRGS